MLVVETIAKIRRAFFVHGVNGHRSFRDYGHSIFPSWRFGFGR